MITPSAPFNGIPSAAPDPLFSVRQRVQADSNPQKVDLSIGVYQDDQGNTSNMSIVQTIHQRLLEHDNYVGYLPIDGLPDYLTQVQQLVFGHNSRILGEKRAVTVQSVGGTSALRYAADFLKRYLPKPIVYLSKPTWPNHRAIFKESGWEIKQYPYYDNQSNSLAFDDLCGTLEGLHPHTVILLHACCHNPTGIDPTPAQWRQICGFIQEKELVPLFDFAYQGLGQGLSEDALPIQMFSERNISFLVASSFSKNFGLYCRRAGALTIVGTGPEEAERIRSQLKTVIRANNSNCPYDGAGIVAAILSDPQAHDLWEQELAGMRERINSMRKQFVDLLTEQNCSRDLNYLRIQKGMFCYPNLTTKQVDYLAEQHSVYTLNDGRINVAGLLPSNIKYVADALTSAMNMDRSSNG